MAVDAALADSVRAGGAPVLRLYRWAPAAVSLGRNQPAAGRYDEDVLQSHGIDIVRRPTGGRAVLHDREITYSAVFPDRLLGSPREAYVAINDILRDALGRLGVEVRQTPESSAVPPLSLEPCFVQPAPGELLASGRKVVGSAQMRVGGVLLQHGSLMLGRSPLLDRLPAALAEALEGAPAYLNDLGPSRLEPEEVIGAIAAAWSERLGPLKPAVLDDAEVADARVHARVFRDPTWTWRR